MQKKIFYPQREGFTARDPQVLLHGNQINSRVKRRRDVFHGERK